MVYIVVCVDKLIVWVCKFDNKNYVDIDVVIVIEYICLVVVEIGLGSCWVCNFDLELFKVNFRLLFERYLVVIVLLGYI